MTRHNERRAARLLRAALDKTSKTEPELDALIPEYVRAELAGESVQTQFPHVHHYILENQHAQDLYIDLAAIEEALLNNDDTSSSISTAS